MAWIKVDMKLNFIDEKERDGIIFNQYGVTKPKPYRPSIEKDCRKELGFGIDELEKMLNDFSISSHYYFSVFNDDSYIKEYDTWLRSGKIKLNNAHLNRVFNNCTESKFKKYKESREKYLNFYYSHPKIKKYFENKNKYISLVDKVNKEICFSKSIYNRPGMLVQLQDAKTKNFSSFLIGSKSNIVAFFDSRSDVVRVKRLIEEEDITEDLIFM